MKRATKRKLRASAAYKALVAPFDLGSNPATSRFCEIFRFNAQWQLSDSMTEHLRRAKLVNDTDTIKALGTICQPPRPSP